jgi:hypothetical protein
MCPGLDAGGIGVRAITHMMYDRTKAKLRSALDHSAWFARFHGPAWWHRSNCASASGPDQLARNDVASRICHNHLEPVPFAVVTQLSGKIDAYAIASSDVANSAPLSSR